MKVVIFGVGTYYSNRKQQIKKVAEVVAFLDNNIDYFGTMMDEVCVYKPEQINDLSYDYILLMSLNATDMEKQLLGLGISSKKLLYYEKFLEIAYGGSNSWFPAIHNKVHEKKILLATPNVNINGAANAIIRAAGLLKHKYNVTIACSEGMKERVLELQTDGITVAIVPALYTAEYEKNEWMQDYELMIVNSVYLFDLFYRNRKSISSILWLHDPASLVKSVKSKIDYKVELQDCKNRICAVSTLARDAFTNYFPIKKEQITIMPFGIPDIKQKTRKREKIIFASIGLVYSTKGQDILLKALDFLSAEEIEKIEIWIIGRYDSQTAYVKNLFSYKEKYNNIKFFGLLNQEEMNKAYSEINVVVSSSRSDMFPTVLIEGMMNEKVCLSTDVTGVAEYIQDEYNGLVYHGCDSQELAKKIKWIINHVELIDEMGKKARETFEKNFSMEQFDYNLNLQIEKVIQ